MKIGKRIAALALSLVVALGSVCYRPPKAEAVVVESALASAAISTYLSATGFEFFGGGMNNTEINEAIHGELCELTKAFAESIDQLNDEVTTVITSGVTWAENGVVKFSAAAANMLGRFSDWFIEKFGLVAGGDSAYFVGSFLAPPLSSDLQTLEDNGYKMALFYRSSGELCLLSVYSGANVYVNGKSYVVSGSTPSAYKVENGEWVFSQSFSYGVNMGLLESESLLWSSFDVYNSSNECVSLGSKYIPILSVGPSVSVELGENYEAAPDVDEQYAMVVDTGLTFADEQSYIDAVLGGVAAGTLSPTYTIEETTAGDVTVPGEDAEDDTQVGILNWTKKIWQSVIELPQTIANAVANVFVPSEEYMATVPETIADTFGSRTGFLTYPTSVLYDFADMLSETSGDFVLSWPDIREPSTGGVMMEAGQFNVSKFVRDNDMLADFYIIYQYVVGAYMTFLFFGLCRRKYNSVVGDRLGA